MSSAMDMITLDHIRATLRPKGIAVVGATERMGSVGRTTLENLMTGYATEGSKMPFEIYPVNPTRDNVLGLKCYKSVSAIDTGLCEAVVIITPASKCNEVVKDCTLNKSVKSVIVIAAGFKEVGPEGLALERELVATASEAGIAVVGPNCLGVMCPGWKMNATFAAASAPEGSVAFVSQSGAMCTAVLDWALQTKQGFSAFISIGSMSHIEWSNFIEYLGEDQATKAIIIYMETIGDATKFMNAARTVTPKKPIIVIKAGKTAAAAAAAVSHTGSLAGSHDAFLAAMHRVGVLVVDTIDELQHLSQILALQPRSTGPGLYIVTNAGGPGVLTTDAAAVAGLEINELEESIKERLNAILPAAWSHANPIDVLGDAKADVYAKSVEAVMERGRKGSALLVILSPQSVTEPDATAQAVADMIQAKRGQGSFDGPIMCAWMGGQQVTRGRSILVEAGVPCFAMPDIAASALAQMWKQAKLAKGISPIANKGCPSAKSKALDILKPALAEKRTMLTESEAKDVMKAYGIDVAESIVCNDVEAAVKAGSQVRFPCVIKLNSETITHKSDVGGVKLGIKDEEGVRKAWNDIKCSVDKLGAHHFQGVSVQPMLDVASGVELLVGSTNDKQFGPMVVFGAGGCLVEVFRDAAMSVPPMDEAETSRLIDSTKISKALEPGHGERFKGCPRQDLEKAVSAFGMLVCDLWEHISECEINPLLALPDRVIALDARIVLRDVNSEESVNARPCLI